MAKNKKEDLKLGLCISTKPNYSFIWRNGKVSLKSKAEMDQRSE
jgi:hypothetical protein